MIVAEERPMTEAEKIGLQLEKVIKQGVELSESLNPNNSDAKNQAIKKKIKRLSKLEETLDEKRRAAMTDKEKEAERVQLKTSHQDICDIVDSWDMD